jgi:hypothetical protein
MRRMLAAAIAELRELKPTRRRLLVLRRRVIPLLTNRALQCHDFTHVSILSDFSMSRKFRLSRDSPA